MIYEMICGETPFWKDGMEQIDLFKAIASGQYTFPDGRFTDDAMMLIMCILETDPSNRLGSLAGGPKEMYKSSWFEGFDFHKLKRKEIRAPWVPEITDALDCCYFDDWSHLEDRMASNDPPISPQDAAIFKEF